jgi:hypothetical protein
MFLKCHYHDDQTGGDEMGTVCDTARVMTTVQEHLVSKPEVRDLCRQPLKRAENASGNLY